MSTTPSHNQTSHHHYGRQMVGTIVAKGPNTTTIQVAINGANHDFAIANGALLDDSNQGNYLLNQTDSTGTSKQFAVANGLVNGGINCRCHTPGVPQSAVLPKQPRTAQVNADGVFYSIVLATVRNYVAPILTFDVTDNSGHTHTDQVDVTDPTDMLPTGFDPSNIAFVAGQSGNIALAINKAGTPAWATGGKWPTPAGER